MSAVRIEKDRHRNAMVRRRLLWDGAHVPGAAREIREACAKDVLFWVNYFCWTHNPRLDPAVVPFVTYPFQDEAILEIQDAIRNGRDVAIEKSRDMGASWLNVLVPLHQLQFSSMKSFLFVSRNESYVDEQGNPKSLFWKIDFLLKHQPRWLKPLSLVRKSMHLENGTNGTVLSGESTTGEVARGDRRTAILLDEFAAFETKAGYAALASTQATTNCRIFNSTPKGVANAFYDVVKKSSAKVIRMHWSQHPEKNKGLYTAERDEDTGRMKLKLLSDWRGVVEVCQKGSKLVKKVAFPEDYPFVLDGKMRSPWYDRECSRAVNPVEIAQELDIDYQGSDYQFFDPMAVERYKEQWCREPEMTGDIGIAVEQGNALRITASPKGHFSMFVPLDASGRVPADEKFVLGVDVSAGTGASNSTFAAYSRRTNEKVAEFADPTILPDNFARLVVAAARFFNDAMVVPDRSGPTGEVFVRRVLAEGYTNLYFRRNERKIGAPKTDEPGVWLNPAMKTAVLTQYRDAIGRVTVVNRSERAMDECLRFIMTQNGNVEHSSATNANDPSGARTNHGDLVIADALATLALTENAVRDVPQEQRVPYNSLAWRMREERERAAENNTDNLGGEWEP